MAAPTTDDKIVTQSTLKKIIEKCNQEKINNKLFVPIEDVEARVSFYTGLPKDYIIQLSKSLPSRSEPSPSLDFQIMVLTCMQHFYRTMQYPTLKDVYNVMTGKIGLPPFSIFVSQMEGLGYCFRKTSHGYLLMENPKSTFERYDYLKKILKYRQSNNIHYFEARIIDEKCLFNLASDDLDKNTKGNLYFCYIVFQNDTSIGIFCNDLQLNTIVNWLKNIVMQRLPPCSIIVMNKSFLSNKSINEKPSPCASKDTMLKWLRTNHIPCTDNMRKADLYSLISKSPDRTCSGTVDWLFQAHGHQVLRLPSSLEGLTPSEMAWKDIRTQLTDQMRKDVCLLKEFIFDSMSHTLCVSKKWCPYNMNVQINEKKIYEIDKSIEELLESYVFLDKDPFFECNLGFTEKAENDIKTESSDDEVCILGD